jgi:hypothetical protein
MSDDLKCPICGKEIRRCHVRGGTKWFFECSDYNCIFKSLYLAGRLSESAVIEAFRKATRADKQGIQWVSVKERLPENVRDVLTCTKENQATCNIGFYDNDTKKWELYKGIGSDVDYWAEINLPKGE